MTTKSTANHYGSIAVTLHWLSALLILVLVGSGFRADGLEEANTKAASLRVHVPVGVTILLLTLACIIWWFFADRKPASVPMPSWKDCGSRVVHVLFHHFFQAGRTAWTYVVFEVTDLCPDQEN